MLHRFFSVLVFLLLLLLLLLLLPAFIPQGVTIRVDSCLSVPLLLLLAASTPRCFPPLIRMAWHTHRVSLCDTAAAAACSFYATVFPTAGQDDVALLDICSSWVSHYPPGYTAGKIVGELNSAQQQSCIGRTVDCGRPAVSDVSAWCTALQSKAVH
jgi:hypothetical protein